MENKRVVMFVDGLPNGCVPTGPQSNQEHMTTRWRRAYLIFFFPVACARVYVCVCMAGLPARPPVASRGPKPAHTQRDRAAGEREKHEYSEERSNKSQLSRHCPHSPPLCPRRLCAAPVLRLRLKAKGCCAVLGCHGGRCYVPLASSRVAMLCTGPGPT